MVAAMRALPMAMLVLVACAEDDARRPRTVEYLTETILIPSCAPAQCHSTFTQADGFSFSTVEEARAAITDFVAGSLVEVDRGIPSRAMLVNVLERTVDRMPYDQPLANADIDVIREFIAIGAPGAQCNPAYGAQQCLVNKLYTCGDDFNYQDLVEDCALRAPTVAGGVWRCISTACFEVRP